MNLEQLIDRLKRTPSFMENVTHWETLPAKEARFAPFPEALDSRLPPVLAARGVHQLYTHQREAFDRVAEGRDICVVTPTASGKTMCYNLPVLNAILKNGDARALYLFPTKALSADQVSELYELIEAMDVDVKTFTYDGDTPAAARRQVRQAGHIVVTNPDMLHSGILPHHTKWVKLFENLQYVVIDEIHAYRGVFGSNLANVIRRLTRLCKFYGSNPQFICCSATIANPGELASTLIGRPVDVIDQSGAASGEKHIVFYNPPVVNKQLGIRKSVLQETLHIASMLVDNDISTIVFGKSRLTVEVLTRHLKERVKDPFGNAGRAGRRKNTALTIMVASSSALDQYIVNHPEYFFSRSPENALVHPDNLYVLLGHVKCAAYELPFEEGESYAKGVSTRELLDYLCEEHILNLTGGRYYWMAEEFPAADLSLRSVTSENFLIIDITRPEHRVVIGEMDRYTVPMLLHEHAIYMHEGQQYQVEKLDFTEKKAYVRSVDVDYYTDADLNTSVKVLDVLKEQPLGNGSLAFGDVLVTWLVTMFKKFKLDTQETLGFGPVDLPELEMPTNACWWALDESVTSGLSMDDLQGGMLGIANALRQIIPLYLMCSPRDICVQYRVRDPFTKLPTLLVFDNYAGGIGLSERVFGMRALIFSDVHDLIARCPCEAGCPSCTGPMTEVGEHGKKTALLLTERLMAL